MKVNVSNLSGKGTIYVTKEVPTESPPSLFLASSSTGTLSLQAGKKGIKKYSNYYITLTSEVRSSFTISISKVGSFNQLNEA